MGQLRSKRDEFWETQPAFDGRREIWDALRAACETDDQSLAQAIVDGASISLPTGKNNVFPSSYHFYFINPWLLEGRVLHRELGSRRF